MKKLLCLFLPLFLLFFLPFAAYAEDAALHSVCGIEYQLSGAWTSESFNDGSVLHRSESSGGQWLLRVIPETINPISFNGDFSAVIAYIQGFFSESSAWLTMVDLISRNGIFGGGGCGFIEGMPSALVFIENDLGNVAFVLSSVDSAFFPAQVSDRLLGFFPWLRASGSNRMDSAVMLDFKIGDYTYSVPDHWIHSYDLSSGAHHHAGDDGKILYILSARPDKSMSEALETCRKMYPDSTPEIFRVSEISGIKVSAALPSGSVRIEAYIPTSPGHLVIKYDHAGSDPQIQDAEFEDLLLRIKPTIS